VNYTYEYPHPAVAVDIVVLSVDASLSDLQVLLVRRGDDPFKGALALPGGFVNLDEDLDAAAARELREETSVDCFHLEQIGAFGRPDRDPRERVISVAYMALVCRDACEVRAGSDAASAEWYPIIRDLAFDHLVILTAAIERLRTEICRAPIGFHLLPSPFTLGQLQRLYETILDRPLDKRNFRRRVLAMGVLREAKLVPALRAGKFFRFDKRAYDRAVRDGLRFGIWG